jgi:O-antigen/teichoic acid export membrane protein
MATVPIFIRFIGIEAWGIMGIYATLATATRFFDLGLSVTLNRELARRSVDPGPAEETRNLVRTLEAVYWGMALLIGTTIVFLVPFLTSHWVRTVELRPETVARSLVLIAVIIALQWPVGLYSGGLLGLQRQIQLALTNAAITTIRAVGAMLLLWLVSPTIEVFLGWQLGIGAVSAAIIGGLLWWQLPKAQTRATIRLHLLKKVWRFTAGITLAGVLGLLLSQIDKLILSKMLTLESFGYYTLAGTLSAGLYQVITSIHSAVFPRLTQLVAKGREDELAKAYHEASEIVAVLLLPAVVVIALFAREVMQVWVGNPTTVENTCRIVALMAIGTGLSGVTVTSWALQLAHGWTRLSFYLNAGQVLVTAPAIVLLSWRYQGLGAASSWVIVNLVLVVLQPWLTHRKLLKGELLRWYVQDTGRPLGAALVIAVAARAMMPTVESRAGLGAVILLISAATQAAALLSSKTARRWIAQRLGRSPEGAVPPALR